MTDIINSIPTDLLAAGMSLVMLVLVKFTKKTGLDTRIIVAIITGAIAALWVAITNYVPVEVQQSATEFASKVFAIQWALYELWRSRNK